MDTVETIEAGAVDALRLAIPLAKTIPLIGSTIEGSLLAVLHIIRIKEVRLLPCSN